jgi:hypothetical protein
MNEDEGVRFKVQRPEKNDSWEKRGFSRAQFLGKSVAAVAVSPVANSCDRELQRQSCKNLQSPSFLHSSF